MSTGEGSDETRDYVAVAGSDPQRLKIAYAMQRVLRGETHRKLTIKDLAEEAGVSRSALTHKHTDLKDLFNAEVAREGLGAEPVAVGRLREEMRSLKRQNAEKRDRIQGLEVRESVFIEHLSVAVARVRYLEAELKDLQEENNRLKARERLRPVPSLRD